MEVKMIDIFNRVKVKELEKGIESLRNNIGILVVEINELKLNRYGKCGDYIPDNSPIWILAKKLESLFDYLDLESYYEKIDDPEYELTKEVPQIKVVRIKKKK